MTPDEIKAMKRGREMDRRIAGMVLGWDQDAANKIICYRVHGRIANRFIKIPEDKLNDIVYISAPNFSTDINVAWPLLYMHDRFIITNDRIELAHLHLGEGVSRIEGDFDSMEKVAEGICKAAILSKVEERGY